MTAMQSNAMKKNVSLPRDRKRPALLAGQINRLHTNAPVRRQADACVVESRSSAAGGAVRRSTRLRRSFTLSARRVGRGRMQSISWVQGCASRRRGSFGRDSLGWHGRRARGMWAVRPEATRRSADWKGRTVLDSRGGRGVGARPARRERPRELSPPASPRPSPRLTAGSSVRPVFDRSHAGDDEPCAWWEAWPAAMDASGGASAGCASEPASSTPEMGRDRATAAMGPGAVGCARRSCSRTSRTRRCSVSGHGRCDAADARQHRTARPGKTRSDERRSRALTRPQLVWSR
jgi:hypothetical protein